MIGPQTPGGRAGLASHLRALREATRPRLSQAAAGRVLGGTQNLISRIEAGQRVPTVDEVRALCDAYGATKAATAALVRSADAMQPRTTGRLQLYRRSGGTRRMQDTINRLQDGAARICGVYPGIVPGELQTEAYVAAVFDGGDPAAMQLRLDRIAATLADDVRRFTLIMTEGALLANLPGAAAMADLCEHVAAVSRRPNFDVRLITHEQRTVSLFVQHGWQLYDDMAVVVGVTHGTSVLTQPEDVRGYRERFGELYAVSIGGDDVRRHLARIAALYRS